MEQCPQKSEYIIGCQMINVVTQLLCSKEMSKENCHEGFGYLISASIRWVCRNIFHFSFMKTLFDLAY